MAQTQALLFPCLKMKEKQKIAELSVEYHFIAFVRIHRFIRSDFIKIFYQLYRLTYARNAFISCAECVHSVFFSVVFRFYSVFIEI